MRVNLNLGQYLYLTTDFRLHIEEWLIISLRDRLSYEEWVEYQVVHALIECGYVAT